MKFSTLILASLAVSAQAVATQDYEDGIRYPFGAPYSSGELASHEEEMKANKLLIGKK